MPTTYINATEQGNTDTRTILAKLVELLPSGTGYVRILPDGTLTLDTPSGGGGSASPFREKLIVSATNVLSQLSYTPRTGTVVKLTIRGLTHSSLSSDFTVSGKNITIAGGGYAILATWNVEAEYYTDDTITPPTITSFAPSSASVGGTLVITGTGFFGVQSVIIGGVAQTTYTVNSATQITVTLGAGTYSTNTVVVITASGAATRAGFTYLDPTPTITAVLATVSAIGNPVVINGTNFTGATAVRFGGTNAASYVVNSATQITATIADTGTAGTVQVVTPFGTATSASSISLDTILPMPRSGREMTATTTTFNTIPYTASGNANNAGQEAWRAFTLNAANYYFGVTQNGTEYLQIQCGLRFKEASYTIFTPNLSTNYLPKNWFYEASNDGVTWVTLDSRTNQALAGNTQYTYPVTSNAGYYSCRRIRITATQLVGWPPALRLMFN
jgi:hypothetical protein